MPSHKFKTVHKKLGVSRWTSMFGKLKIMVIGDMHEIYFGENNQKMCDRIVEENPDYIFAVGDMLDRRKKSGKAFIKLIEGLGGLIPVYMCHGNHETKCREEKPEAFDEYYSELQRLDVHVLDDDRVVLEKNNELFAVYGLTAFEWEHDKSPHSVEKSLGKCPENMPSIVLCHNPKWFDLIAAWGADLVLSGHIHGGVVRLPIFGGMLAPGFRLLPHYNRGEYHIGKSVMYVTAGLGGLTSKLNIRLFNPREIVALTLMPHKTIEKAKAYALSPILRMAACALLIMLAWLSVSTAMTGIVNAFVIAPVLFYAAVFLYLLLPKKLVAKIKQNRFLDGMLKCIKASVAVGVAAALVILCGMAAAANVKPTENDGTVIVLGCQIHGDRPSIMLARRLDAAFAYLSKNPDSKCVVSGGKAPTATYSEADVMRKYLTEKGIDGSRIFLEGKSVNTYENINFSAQVIKKEGLNRNVVIASDGFHQLRAKFMSERAGLEPSAAPCKTPWYLVETMTLREFCAVAKGVVLGF